MVGQLLLSLSNIETRDWEVTDPFNSITSSFVDDVPETNVIISLPHVTDIDTWLEKTYIELKYVN